MIYNRATLWKNCLRFTYGLCVLLAHPAVGATSDDISTGLAKPTVNFENSLSTITERDGIITLKVIFSHEFSGQLTYSVDGTAEQGADFSVPELSVETSNPVSKINIDIDLRDDTEVEDIETLRVTLRPSEGFELGPTRQHTISIEDNDTNWRVIHDVDGMRYDYGIQILRNGENTDATMISHGGNIQPDTTYPVKLVRADDSQFEAVVGPVKVGAARTLLGTEIARTFFLTSDPSAVPGHEINYERSLVGTFTETWQSPQGGAFFITSDTPKISGTFAMFRIFEESDPLGIALETDIPEPPQRYSECSHDEIAVTNDDNQASAADNVPYEGNVKDILKRAKALLYSDDGASQEMNGVAAFRYEELINNNQASGSFKDYWTCNEKLRAHEAAKLIIEPLKFDPWNQELRRTLLDIYYGIAKADKISAMEKQVDVAQKRAMLVPTEENPFINDEIKALEEVLFLYRNAFTDYMEGILTVFEFDAVDFVLPLIRQALAAGAHKGSTLAIAPNDVKQLFRQALAELAYEELAVRIAPGDIQLLVHQELASLRSSRCGDQSLATLGAPDPKLVAARVQTFARQALVELAQRGSDLRIAPSEIEPLVRRALEGLAHEKSAINDILSREGDYGKTLAQGESDWRIAPGDMEPLVRQAFEDIARDGHTMPIASGDINQSVFDSLAVILGKSSSISPCPANSLNRVDGGIDAFTELVADSLEALVADSLEALVADSLVELYAAALADDDIHAFSKLAASTLDGLFADVLDGLFVDALDGLFIDALGGLFVDALTDDGANKFTKAFVNELNCCGNEFSNALDRLVTDNFNGLYADALDELVEDAYARLFSGFFTDGDTDEFTEQFATELADFAEGKTSALAKLFASKLGKDTADHFAEIVADRFARYVSTVLAKDAFFFDKLGRSLDKTNSNGFIRQRDLVLLFDLLRDYLRTAEDLTKLYIARLEGNDFSKAHKLFYSAIQSTYLEGYALLAMFPEIELLEGADYIAMKDAVAGWRLSYSTFANIRNILNGDINLLGYPDEILVLSQSEIPGDDQSFHTFAFFQNRLKSEPNPLSQAVADQTTAISQIEKGNDYNDRREQEKAATERYYYERLRQIVGVWPFEDGYDDPSNNDGEIAWQLKNIEIALTNIERSRDAITKLEKNIREMVELRSTTADIYSAMSKIYIDYGEKQVSLSEEIAEIRRKQAEMERITAAAKSAFGGLMGVAMAPVNPAAAVSGGTQIRGAILDLGNAAIQADLEKRKNSLEVEKERLAAKEKAEITDSQGALRDAEIRQKIRSLFLEAKALELDALDSAIGYQQALSRLSALYYEKENLERRKIEDDSMLASLYFANPSHRLRKIAALLRSESSFENARRWLFLAMRAAEYKWNTQFEGRQALFKARNAKELRDFYLLLQLWDENIILGSRNDNGEKVFSIRDHFLGNRNSSRVGEASHEFIVESQKRFHEYLNDEANYLSASDPDNPIPGFKVLKFNFSTAFIPASGGLFLSNRWNEKIRSLKVWETGGTVGNTGSFIDGYLRYGGVGLIRNRARGKADRNDPSRLVNETTAYSMQSWKYQNGMWRSVGKFGAPINILVASSPDIELGSKEINVFKEFSVATTDWELFVAVESSEGMPLLDVNCSDDQSCLDDIMFKINYYWYAR